MIEWDVAFRLESEYGTVEFNDPESEDGYFVLIENDCKATRTLRATTDPIPQADGELLHRRFRDGTEITLAVQLWENFQEPACGKVRREMYERLVAVLDGMLNGNGRLYWSPTDYAGEERMLDSARWLTPIEVNFDGGVPVCTFTVDSPYPYVLDKTQRESEPGAGGILVPAGVPTSLVLPEFSAAFWPVMKAYPDSGTWNIINSSVDDEWGEALGFYYSASRPPGAGAIPNPHYAEIDTFRETVYYDGNQANLKPYVNPELTDYFFLQPGSNLILATNVDVLFLINNAWAVG